MSNNSDNLHKMNPNSANDLYNLNTATTAMAPGSMMVGGGGGNSINTTYLSSGMPSQQQQQQQQNSTAAAGATSNNTTTNSLFLQLQAQQQQLQQQQQQYANNGYGNNNTEILPLNDNGSSNNNNIATASGGAPSDFQTYRSSIASLASNNTSHTSANNNSNHNDNDDDDTSSDAYRRVSKESLASHESLSDMLNSNSLNSVVVTTGSSNLSNIGSYSAGLAAGASGGVGGGMGGGANNGGMDPQQQQNLLNLLQRQQMQMGSMGVNTHTGMMQGISNNGGVGGGVVGGGNDMNLFMNYMGTAQGGGGGGLDGTTNNLMNNNPSGQNQQQQSQQQQPTQTETNFQALSIPTKKSRHKQTFAMKLMNILSIKECQSSIRWMPNGRAFCIVDPKLLVEKVLPVYFKEAKYASFTRKLNRWGFKHYSLSVTNASDPSSTNTTSTSTTAAAAASDKEMSIYSHDKFRRDDPTLCHTMDGGHRRRNARKDEERTRQLYASLQPDMVEMLRSQGGAGSVMGMGMDATQSSIQAMQLKLLQQQQQLQQQKNQMMAMMNNPLYSQGMMGMNMMGGGGTGGGVGGGADVVNNANAAAMVGMRRTSLGFMPYLPTSNVGRRDSMGSVFSGVGITTSMDNDGKIESTFDDVGGDGVGAANGSAGGRGGTGEQKNGDVVDAQTSSTTKIGV